MKVIAARYGAHRGSIPKLVLAAGAPLRAYGLSDIARAQALALHEVGMTLQEIASRLDTDDKTVRNAIVECRLRQELRRIIARIITDEEFPS